MKRSKVSFKKLPVVATRRCYVMSDALFFNVSDGRRSPLEVVRHGVRGTQNPSPFKGANSETVKEENVQDSNDKGEVRGPQVVESAKTHPSAKFVEVEFDLSFIDLANSLSSVAGDFKDEFQLSYASFVEMVKPSDGINEVSRRFARNILNGRWLFRNRLIAKDIVVKVYVEKELKAKAKSLDIPLNEFGDYSNDEIKLGGLIADGLTGIALNRLTIVASLELLASGSVEVFPSQNYRGSDKNRKSKDLDVSRSLYTLNRKGSAFLDYGPALVGQAALRDQKVANALRTIDTWYPSEDVNPRPIPVEQLGANLEELKFFRSDKNGKQKNAYRFMLNLNNLDPNSADGMYMIACLVRGGVYA